MSEPGALPHPLAREVARLQARVETLEAALARRSLELRVLQRTLCADDLVALERLAAGRPPRSALERWQESAALVETDVESALAAVWRADGTVDLWRELSDGERADAAATAAEAGAAPPVSGAAAGTKAGTTAGDSA